MHASRDQARSITSLSQLPEDLLCKILAATGCGEACGVRTRCQLSTVCVQWNHILSRGSFWQEMLFITNTFRDAEVLSTALIGSACRAEAAGATWRIQIAEAKSRAGQVAGQTVACRFVYGLQTRLQRHIGAHIGFAAGKKELETWLAEVVHRCKFESHTTEHDKDILIEVLTGKRFCMPPTSHSRGSLLIAGRALKDVSRLLLYMCVGVWAHLLLSFVCAPVIGCVYLLTRA